MPGEFSTELFQDVDQIIDNIFPQLVEMRRHLHMHPELSWNEEHTTRYIAERVSNLDLPFTPGPRGRGGICDIQSSDYQTERCIAMRGDIDAIPVFEENEVEYCSRYEDVMHACGHDVHTTVAYGVCHVLAALRAKNHGSFPGHVRVIFQPAEEVAEGAREVVQQGALEGVEAILAMHVDSQREIGTIGLREHVQTARSDEIKIMITASGGHAARPHETTDPILAAAQFINACYSQIPRSIDVRKPAVLTFCQIEGGKSANVIPTKVWIHGTLRTFDIEIRDAILSQLRSLSDHIGAALGSAIKIETGVSLPPVDNSPEMIGLLRRAAETFMEPRAIETVEPSLGGEDFATYQQHIPGALVRVGCANGSLGSAPLHSPHFDVDEEVIRMGCRLLTRSLLIWLGDANSYRVL